MSYLCRYDTLRKICVVHMESRKVLVAHVDVTGPIRQHNLDHAYHYSQGFIALKDMLPDLDMGTDLSNI